MTRKVLMLHGFAQNALILSKRLGALRKACGKDLELVFVDAPHVLNPVDMADAFGSSNLLQLTGAPEDPTLTPRGWWTKGKEYHGLEESIALLKDMLMKDRYVGAFGFSQGAGMAAILAALLERPHLYPPFLAEGDPPHPPFEFCVVVAGFKPVGPICTPLFEPSLTTPTLHVLGRTDVVVVEERSKTLLDVSSNKRVEWHGGGHFVPSKASWRVFFREYMLGNTDAVSPEPIGAGSNIDSTDGV